VTGAPPLDLIAGIAFLALCGAVAYVSFRWVWPAPAAIVATAPFAWYHTLGPTEITVSKAAFAGAALGLIALLAADRERRQLVAARMRTDWALLSLAAFAAFSLCSVMWAHSPVDAVRDGLKWVWYAGTFAIVAAAIDTRAGALKVVYAALAACIAVCVVGGFQAATAAPSSFAENGDVIGRITSTLEGPNQFGAYLETIIPMLAASLWFGGVSWPALAAGSLMLGALCAELLLAYSRGSLWSCVAALAFLAAVTIVHRRADFSCPVRRAAISIAIAALIVVPVAHSRMNETGWHHEIWAAGWEDASDSAQRRRELWSCATEVFERRPVAGVGAGNFADAMSTCTGPVARLPRSNANNWYLETAADLGAVGIIMLAGFLLPQLRAVRAAVADGDPIALGGLAVLVAFALHGFVDDVMPYPKAALTFFALLALIPVARQGPARSTG